MLGPYHVNSFIPFNLVVLEILYNVNDYAQTTQRIFMPLNYKCGFKNKEILFK